MASIENRGSAEPLAAMGSGSSEILDDIIGRSFELLPSEEKRVLRTACLFTPDLSKQALSDVLGLQSYEVEQALSRLYNWRLVEHDPEGRRWWPSNHVVAYIMAHPMAMELWFRFAGYVVDSASTIAKENMRHVSNRILDEWRGNLDRVMDWCVLGLTDSSISGDEAKRIAELSVRLLRSTHIFLYETGSWQRLHSFARFVMDKAIPIVNQPEFTADAHYFMGLVAENEGDNVEAGRRYSEALKLYEESGHKKGIADVLDQVGLLFERSGDLSKARESFNRSLALKIEIGDGDSLWVMHRIGILAQRLGEREAAKEIFGKGLRQARNKGDEGMVAFNLDQLARIAERDGDLNMAERFHKESLSLKIAMKHKRGISYTLDGLGELARIRHQTKKAGRLHADSLGIKEELGDAQGIAHTKGELALLAFEQERFADSEQLYQEALILWQRMGNKKRIANTKMALSKLKELSGDPRAAYTLNQGALDSYIEVDAGGELARRAQENLSRLESSLKEAGSIPTLGA